MSPELALHFIGRFQCRLAVDPDPYDDEYGLRGDTIVLPGEPPFDRAIRTTEVGATVREYCPRPGLCITNVVATGCSCPDWLKSGLVSIEPYDASGGPRFEEWNGINGLPANTPLSGFRLRVFAGYRTILERRSENGMILPLADPATCPAWANLSSMIAAFAPAAGHRELMERRDSLLRSTAVGQNAVDVVKTRLRLLEISESVRGNAAYTAPRVYQCLLGGAAHVSDPRSVLDRVIDTSASWSACLAFTRWDYDSMSGVLAGTLTIPMRS